MPFRLDHPLVSAPLELSTHNEGDEVFFRVAHSGTFSVLYPGKLWKHVTATVTHRDRTPQQPAEPELPTTIEGQPARTPTRPAQPAHSGVNAVAEPLHVTLTILTPDGEPFLADEVTLADLRKFRDIRGIPVGRWSYTLGGESRRYRLNEAAHETVTPEPGELELSLLETVASESAPPLLTNTPLDGSRQTFRFDLFREGTFVAEIATSADWKGSMRLVDPDGTAVARTASKTLRHEVDLAGLRKSRDRDGRLREWSLQVSPQGGVVVGGPMVSATVYGSGRITTDVLQRRVLKLIGENGRFIQLFGKQEDGFAKAKLRVTDPAAAEAIDMHRLLEKRLKPEWNAPLDVRDFDAGEEYTLYRTKEYPAEGYGLRVDVSTLNLDALRVSIGAAKRLDPAIPAINLQLDVSGEARIEYEDVAFGADVSLGTAHVTDGRAEMEVGVTLDGEGLPQLVTWVSEDAFDVDLSGTAIAGLASVPLIGPTLAVLAVGVTEAFEDTFKKRAVQLAREFFADPVLAPTILMTVFGAHLTYTGIRLEGEDIVFEYIAPLEPQRKPREDYVGVIGRRMESFGDGRIRIDPPTLGDTWAASNVTAKIDHVVVVMMENRSYDHVLGYRAQDPLNEPSDGLTPEIVIGIQEDPNSDHPDPDPLYRVRNLAAAGFPKNEAGKMTRLPRGVGHSYVDVTEQLSVRDRTREGREINGAKGFVDNFTPRVGTDKPDTPEDERMGVVPNDVLGYYDGDQLPMYDYLARNFAYCDRFFSSHPGPTLPNRMFSLTGDLQYDRLGVPLLENNHGDNFLLSRAVTIFDALTKLGVSWRVYESEPSVTMLRMFARYATNNTQIVPIAQLEGDLATGKLPSFTFVEPAMHHHPQDDDHPDADMWRGQRFIWRVYKALRDAPTWERTLLIITYDEHGGFYDHVIPPVADLLHAGRETGGVIGVSTSVSDGSGGAQPPDEDGEVQPSEEAAARAERRRLLRGSRAGEVDREVATEHEPASPVPPASVVQIPYGVRVPTFLVSPWVPAGPADGLALDFCSIVKTVLIRFAGDDRPFLSDRVQASNSFDALLTEATPRYVAEPPPEPAELPIHVRRLAPDASAIETPHLRRKQMRDGPVESHDVMGRVARMLGR